MVSEDEGSTLGTGQPPYRESDGGEAEQGGGSVVVGVANGLPAVGRAALAGVTREVAPIGNEVSGPISRLVNEVTSVLDEISGAIPDLMGDVSAILGQILGPATGPAVGVLRTAGHLIDGAAHLTGGITGDSAERGLGAAREVAGCAAELVAVHEILPSSEWMEVTGPRSGRGPPFRVSVCGVSACP